MILTAVVAARLASPALGVEVVLDSAGAPAIAMGRVLLYPLFVALVEHNNNRFYTSADDNKTETWMQLISPGAAVELPFSHSLLRAGYQMSTRNYSGPGSHWTMTHTAQFDLRLRFGNDAVVALHDDFREGILDVQVGDPGAELPPLEQTYRTNAAEIYAGHERPERHRLGFHFRPSVTTYTDPRVAPYFDESGWTAEADGDWKVGPRTWIVWAAAGGVVELDRPDSPGGAAETRSQRMSNVRIGARWVLSRSIVLQFLVGPERQSYAAAVPSVFRGPVGTLGAQSTDTTGPRWSVDLSRDAFASIFDTNNYFVSEQVTVRAEMPRAARVRFGGSVAYYRNDYPTDPSGRRDRTSGIEAWLGIRQGVWVEWRASVRYDVRSSTLPGADYSSLRYGVGLAVGR